MGIIKLRGTGSRTVAFRSCRPSIPPLSSGSETQAVKRQVWEDMLAVMERLSLPISERQRGFFLPRAGG